MNYQPHIDHLNAHFKYQTDIKQYGTEELWTDLPKSGLGDCEDYAIALWKDCGGSIYFCRISGSGHAVLKLPNGKWIDSVYKTMVDEFDDCYTDFNKYYTITVYWKIIKGWFKKELS